MLRNNGIIRYEHIDKINNLSKEEKIEYKDKMIEILDDIAKDCIYGFEEHGNFKGLSEEIDEMVKEIRKYVDENYNSMKFFLLCEKILYSFDTNDIVQRNRMMDLYMCFL